MINSYGSLIKYNVEEFEKKSEMILWSDCSVMIFFFVLCVCRCTSYIKEKKRLVSKFYCEGLKRNSFLWSIERESSAPVYLFGTVHAPSNWVWHYIPDNAKDAFNEATHVYSEIDLEDESVFQSINRCKYLPGNLTLEDALPKNLYYKLLKTAIKFRERKKKWLLKLSRSLFKDFNVGTSHPFDPKLKPVWLLTEILQQWNKFFVKSQYQHRITLDAYLVRKAHARNAYHGGIEDVSMHCDPLDKLSADKVNLALNVTLHVQDHKMSGRWKVKDYDIRRTANFYTCGNPMNTSKLVTMFSDFVGKDFQQRLEEIDEYLSRELVYKRNIEMANRIDSMLKNKELDSAKMFFLVGAAHLLSNDSVVHLLQRKGYTVRHIKPDEAIPATIRRKKRREMLFNNWYSGKTTKERPPPVEEKPQPPPPPPIVIIKRVKKTYVYYYNSGNHVHPHRGVIMSTILVLMYYACFL